MKRKKIFKTVIIIIAILFGLIMLGCFLVYCSVRKYIDTHSWATITVSGEVNAETSDAFMETREYLQGEIIAFDSVSLEIKDITHDGTVDFIVVHGHIYDESGKEVREDTIYKGEKEYYKINHGTFCISVDSSRYE